MSDAQVKECIIDKNDVKNAAEENIEPHNVVLEAESYSVKTDNEQDIQCDDEVVNINVSVGEQSDATTEQSSTPDLTEDQQISDFEECFVSKTMRYLHAESKCQRPVHGCNQGTPTPTNFSFLFIL